MTPSEEYWNRRALTETRAALTCNDPHIAALHVDIATRCVRQALLEREQSQPDSTAPAARIHGNPNKAHLG